MEEIYQKLRDATNAKKEGNLDKAISLLKEAYSLAEVSSVQLLIAEELRLPMYLQENGKSVEAEKVLGDLILNNKKDNIRLPQVLDKVRLFYEREKDIKKALAFVVTEAVAHEINQYIIWLTYTVRDYSGFEKIEAKYYKDNSVDHPVISKIEKLNKKGKMNINVKQFESIFKKYFLKYITTLSKEEKINCSQNRMFEKIYENENTVAFKPKEPDYLGKVLSEIIDESLKEVDSLLTT
ncbi:hypothetical protein EHO58_00025 [Leptospira selangorensis]|uniref:hypothetical protein n=1 Tax=Leptospira selangorensis TaxID=2484982 RepID=UPI0010833ADC|nr:hypothetical protein [Leptospira selangorensis]TGK10407.1 hypothetical protein EHO58_00025 [Leptospira selangorensis]